MHQNPFYGHHIKSIILFTLVVFTGFLSPAIQAQDNTLLWKIEGEKIKTSYLFGTVHILPQKDFKLKEKVKEAFNNCEQLVMELDMDDPRLQAEMMKGASMKNGQTIDKLLTQEHYAIVDKEIKSLMGIGLANLNSMKPFMISSMLLPKFLGSQPASFELTLTQMATERKMNIIGLEIVAEQMKVFDDIPYESQAEDLVEMVTEPEKMRAEFDALIELYKSEQMDKINTMTKEYFDDPNEFLIMIDQRNENWIPIIADLSKDKSNFIGVGAGHLGGENGLVVLLRSAGFKVTPIRE